MLEINIPEVVAEVTEAFMRYERALGRQRRRGARRAVLGQPAHAALRHRRKPVWPRGDRRVPQSAGRRST